MDSNIIDFSKTPRVLILSGRCHSGKSNTAKYIIIKNFLDGNLEHGLIFSASVFNNKQYDFYPKKYIIEGYQENILKAYVNKLKDYVRKNNKVLKSFILFDDLIGLLQTRKGYLINLFSVHRHIGLNLIISTQSFKSSSNAPIVREIADYAILYRSLRGDTLQQIYEEFGRQFEDFEEFKEHFLNVTKEQFTAMLYIADAKSKDENFFRIKYPNMDNVKIKIDFKKNI